VKKAKKAKKVKKAADAAQTVKKPVLKMDLQFFAKKGKSKASWSNRDIPVGKQLQGEGQLSTLRRNRNMKGVNVDELLEKTPSQLDDMLKNGDISSKTHKQIKKTFEGRDLGNKGRKN
jgi:hypothetical protein